MPHPSRVCRGRVGILTCLHTTTVIADRGKQRDNGLPYFLPIFSRNRFSCSSVQYPQSNRINTDVYGIVSVLYSTST